MKPITSLFYAHLISVGNMPFLDRIFELDPANAKGRDLYLDFANLTSDTTWSVFSSENAEQGIPMTLWLIEGSQDIREVDIKEEPHGVAIENVITPTSSHLLVLRRHPDKDVFVLYLGVEQVAKDLLDRYKPDFEEFLAQYWAEAQGEHFGVLRAE